MKFFWGLVTGVVGTLLVIFLYTRYTESNNNDNDDSELVGLTMLKQKGECLTKKRLTIFQTIKPNMALAKFGQFPNDLLVMVVNNNGVVYYDDQKIFIPKNKCARQIGTYQYETKSEIFKTVPVVVIE